MAQITVFTDMMALSLAACFHRGFVKDGSPVSKCWFCPADTAGVSNHFVEQG